MEQLMIKYNMKKLSIFVLGALLCGAQGVNAKGTDKEVRGDDAAVRYTGRTFCIHSLRTAQQGAQDEDRKFFHIVFYH